MITIRPVTKRDQWNNFLLTRSPNTFLQSYEWGELQQHMGEGVRYLGLFDNTTQIGAALVLTVNARRGRHWLIPHGPLMVDEERLSEALTALVMYLQEYAADDKSVALRIAPLMPTTPERIASLHSFGFRPAPLHVHTELTWMLDIARDDETLLRGMRKTTRHAIQKAKDAGVTTSTVTAEEGLKRFLPLYVQTKLRHGFVPFPTHYLEAQVRFFSAQNLTYVTIAHHAGKDVAGSLVMQFGSTAFYHHGASLKLPSNIPASHALQWHNIQEAKKRGATRYNFWGIAPEGDATHPFGGITVFKKGFGGYAQDYVHAHDLPLSSRYWLLWGVDRFRKWKRGF